MLGFDPEDVSLYNDSAGDCARAANGGSGARSANVGDNCWSFTWSHRYSSSLSSSRASTDSLAWVLIVSIRNEMYCLFASVRETPSSCFQASHLRFAASSSGREPMGLSMSPVTSPSVACL
ncbi:hypothetical protein OGAPHI_006607 [Ogataea philodendri]|uniref:Uncharacterized protein n=1 Tax=Ogataea philodendri TaxID=1378263 RepID=A0A9P8NWT8_9ASCO|nr:uncharacterized protein OGAPHI_006607 [Ogataea philodendri]KAH3661200.1 hypothetical protein OGAPHI_006607 [Ogataea philodendri]